MKAIQKILTCALCLALCLCMAGLVSCQKLSAGKSDTSSASSAATATATATTSASSASSASSSATKTSTVTEDGTYTSKEDVALYIHLYGHLPSNFISKTKAEKAGWVASKGNLDDVLPGMSIGGSVFHNDDGLLPEKDGRTYKECDVNYTGGYRGSERIIFSNDGLVYYTNDHYKTFEQLY